DRAVKFDGAEPRLTCSRYGVCRQNYFWPLTVTGTAAFHTLVDCEPSPTSDEVVEDAFGRQRDDHDLGEVHLEDGQKEFHGRTADVKIFHRWGADDGALGKTVFNSGKMFSRLGELGEMNLNSG